MKLKKLTLSLMFLVLIGLIISCSPMIQADDSLEIALHPTYVLSGSVQVGELEELVDVSEQLRDISFSEFQVNGDVALGITKENGETTLVAINLRSGEIAGLNTPLSTSNLWPTEEQYFVWTASNVPGDMSVDRIHVYDVSTSETFVVGESDSQRWPDISGNTVIWSEIQEQNWDIYAYDIASSETVPVVTRPGGQIMAKIEDGWIVYIQGRNNDGRNPVWDLYLHNLVTGEDMLIGCHGRKFYPPRQ